MAKIKLNTKQINIFLSVAILAMIFVVVLQSYRLESEDNMDKTDEIGMIINNSESMTESEILEYEDKISDLKRQIKHFQSAKKSDQAQILGNSGSKGIVPTLASLTDQNPVSTNSFEQKHPELEHSMQIDIENEIERFNSLYNPLFEDLDLNPEKMQSLINVFLDMELEGFFLENNSQTMSTDDIISMAVEFDNSIKNILGETNYEQYKLYENTIQDRALMNKFNEGLDDTNQLKKEQLDNIISELNSIRKKYYLSAQYKIGSYSTSISRTDEDYNQTPYLFLPLYEKDDRMYEEYRDMAEKLLSEEQFDKFKYYLSRLSD